jgi:hypothetical protein
MPIPYPTDFDRDPFMTVDPFADFDPRNDPDMDLYPVIYPCYWDGCDGDTLTPGTLCAKCQAEVDAIDPPPAPINDREQAIRNFFNP